MRTFDAVVFDCDGVLVDSEAPWLSLMGGYLADLGLEGIAPSSLRGMASQEAAAELDRVHAARGRRPAAARRSPPSVAEVDAAYSAALAGLADPMPTAPELVRSLAGAVPIAVASNGRRHDVHGLLQRVGIIDLFDAIVTIEDVKRGKPAPDPYLLAARWLGVDAVDVLVLEDSSPGAAAGRAAGCTVIGVNDDPDAALPVDLRLRDLGDLDCEVQPHESGRGRIAVSGPWAPSSPA